MPGQVRRHDLQVELGRNEVANPGRWSEIAEATGDTWKGKYAGSSAALKETGRLLFAAVEFTGARSMHP